jgi:hypothetical protein
MSETTPIPIKPDPSPNGSLRDTAAAGAPVYAARADVAIGRARRDLILGALMQGALLAGLLIGMMFDATRLATVFAVSAAWMTLTLAGRRGTALAAGSSTLIANGLYDAAEVQLAKALSGFSVFRTAKLLSLHHLALLRHTQHRWAESAALSQALLTHRLGPLRGLGRSARLMLAASSVHLGDLRSAYYAMQELYTERLTLSEALQLLRTQVEYEGRIGAWESLARSLPVKVQLAELMPSSDAAAVQGMLALAARKTGNRVMEQWLCRRVGLLCDVQELTARLPMLRELWA